MILVMLRVMALSLLRDRAGLVLVFVLPPLVFIVFASVFAAGASGSRYPGSLFLENEKKTNTKSSHSNRNRRRESP